MEEDVGVGDQDETEGSGHMAGLWLALTDWKVWWMAVALTAQIVGLSFNAYFPTLSQTLGYSTTITLVLCAPPFIWTTIVAFAVSRYVASPQSSLRDSLLTHYLGILTKLGNGSGIQ